MTSGLTIMARSPDEAFFTDEEIAIMETINPREPCSAPPGSKMKVLTMAVRYAHGVDVMNEFDTDINNGTWEMTSPWAEQSRQVPPLDDQDDDDD